MHAVPESLQENLRMTIRSSFLQDTALPLCPQLRLYLLAADYPRGPLDHDEMLAILNEPAYWAFCWASGQVLARYVIDNADFFKDRTVLDFGCGSGVVGIAAALSGARRVVCCDIDPMARDATLANAMLNGVSVDFLSDISLLNTTLDIVIAADVLYDRENMPLLQSLPDHGRDVIIADSRVRDIQVHGYSLIDRCHATTIPDLDEYREYNDVKVYRADSPTAGLQAKSSPADPVDNRSG